jgi:PKD repeat protein
LNATVVDDGLPPGTSVTLAWQIISGPGVVAIGDPNASQTEVAFDQPGVYLLRLTVSDSQWTVGDELTITVLPPNQPPGVSVAPAFIVNFPGPAFLAASVTDDGQPEGAALSAVWSKSSGPGEVTFGSADELNTIALFDAPGVYVLTLTASDSEFSTTANVSVLVNETPEVNAGPDQITT